MIIPEKERLIELSYVVLRDDSREEVGTLYHELLHLKMFRHIANNLNSLKRKWPRFIWTSGGRVFIKKNFLGFIMETHAWRAQFKFTQVLKAANYQIYNPYNGVKFYEERGVLWNIGNLVYNRYGFPNVDGDGYINDLRGKPFKEIMGEHPAPKK